MLVVSLYTPGWREPQWSKPQTSISVVWGVNCSATHHTSCLPIPSAGTKERKIPYPTSNPLTQLFRFVSCPNYTYEVSLTENIFLPGWFYLNSQWWIHGKGPGGPPPLFLDQTEDQRPPYLKVWIRYSWLLVTRVYTASLKSSFYL